MLRTICNLRGDLLFNKPVHSYANLAEYYGVNQYYLWNIIKNEDYYPPAWVCQILKVPARALAPVCPIHGIVHPGRCPRPRKPFQPWLTPEEMEERLDWLERLFG
jgi:hypothetical protein